MKTKISLIGLLFFSLVVLGCGPKNPIDSYYVKGVVKMDGEVQPDVKIMFRPNDTEGGEAASGTTDAKGGYTLTSSNGWVGSGALAGDYTVTVSRMKVTKLPPEKVNPIDGREYSYEELLPNVYQDKENSPLQVTVERKRVNVINLNLSKNPLVLDSY